MTEFVPWTCRNSSCDKHDATDIQARPDWPIRCTCGRVTWSTPTPPGDLAAAAETKEA